MLLLSGCLTLDVPDIPDASEASYQPTTAEMEMVISDLHSLIERCADGNVPPYGVAVQTSVTSGGNLLLVITCDAYTSDISGLGYDGQYELETGITSAGAIDTMRTSISLVVYGCDLGGQIALDLDMIYDIPQDQYTFICCNVNGVLFDQNRMEMLIRQEL